MCNQIPKYFNISLTDEIQDGSEELETEGAREEAMERNN